MAETTRTEGKEKNLFISIFRQISGSKAPFESILGILKDTCAFFGFYSGFVYEADHTGVFHLQEHCPHKETMLKEKFALTDYLGKKEINELIEQGGEITYLYSRKNPMGKKFLEFFSARTLVMVPVIFEEKTPVAFVGLMDRRNPIRLSKKEIDDADAVLSVLAAHIRTRVYQKRLEYTLESMKSIINNQGLDIYVSDYSSREIIFANKSLIARSGGIDNIIGKYCWELFATPGQDKGICKDCPMDKSSAKVCSWDYQDPKTLSWYRVLSATSRWVDGRLATVVSSFDISENKKNEDLVRLLADTDALTKLPNRRKFMADMEAALSLMRKENKKGYLLFMDLDNFKCINDSLGHMEGDLLLCSIGEFLSKEQKTLGQAYRFGGDEFVVLGINKTAQDLLKTRNKLLKRFNTKWDLGKKPISCHISIGAVRIPRGGAPVESLIRTADKMMYEVKRSGKQGFKEAALLPDKKISRIEAPKKAAPHKKTVKAKNPKKARPKK
ncbi:MAG: sensor domain-containing diguanylate cyclase [Treponema sp.]|jgi:diguanylate cyclase (GGDEF)-like protein|nr:sensor domain-containing diguanylate cyclase [Treponema sp.]